MRQEEIRWIYDFCYNARMSSGNDNADRTPYLAIGVVALIVLALAFTVFAVVVNWPRAPQRPLPGDPPGSKIVDEP